jgi:urease accessory protein
MRVVEGVVGNVEDDPDLAAAADRHREAGTLERLVLDETERRRSRFRGETETGTSLGVVVSDGPLLAGDVLVAEESRFVVVALAERPAFAVDFAAETAPVDAAAFGHALGNRHWPFAVRAGTGYVAAGSDPEGRRTLLERLLPAGAAIERTTVEPAVFDAGGAVGGEHAHDHGNDDENGNPDGHAHDHAGADHD